MVFMFQVYRILRLKSKMDFQIQRSHIPHIKDLKRLRYVMDFHVTDSPFVFEHEFESRIVKFRPESGFIRR